MGWHWHQLDHTQSFAPLSRQITTPVSHCSVFTGRMPFLPPNQQRQSTLKASHQKTKLNQIQQKTSMYHTHTHTQPFYGPFSGTTRVSRCQRRTSGVYGARKAEQRQTQRPSLLTSAHLHHRPIFTSMYP